jgi:hypothetical protein
MASFASAAAAEYKAGMWGVIYGHGIIYKEMIFDVITQFLRIQSSSNMDDYGFSPSTDVLNLIAESIHDGSQSIIDELKRRIRFVENLEFQKIMQKEQFTCTTSESITFFIDLYSNKKNKYNIKNFEYHCSDIIRQLNDANVIDTPEMKQKIRDCVLEIYQEMIKNIQNRESEIYRQSNPSDKLIRERSRSPRKKQIPRKRSKKICE